MGMALWVYGFVGIVHEWMELGCLWVWYMSGCMSTLI